ncbi:MAG TPA: ankyrin repeat domain-containing protein, partial [Spirochaetia bacterium]|nr:ankyrin repeat domain-containing protein [Spirochaetia bacterium]
PNASQIISVIVAEGGNPNAPSSVSGGEHAETPLHWAASNDDVAAIDALLENGADIESPGAVFTNGSPLSDAVVFGQWQAARRLLGRGARPTFWQAAALGLLELVQERLAREPPPSSDEITNAFWNACRGGSRQTAELLLSRGADLNWVGHGGKTALAAARESGRGALAAWLREIGARSTSEL